eukprot:TRINITY_DN4228_c0_g1_i1.p5 TRINITY_DN4228_c0_g1~~TRINITY_DN4228_c0_g1_i1.p5  ORF type:complete len:110 (-),score=3.03 TRINITY_DN4228_c0_g1_i1:59-388(-)
MIFENQNILQNNPSNILLSQKRNKRVTKKTQKQNQKAIKYLELCLNNYVDINMHAYKSVIINYCYQSQLSRKLQDNNDMIVTNNPQQKKNKNQQMPQKQKNKKLNKIIF